MNVTNEGVEVVTERIIYEDFISLLSQKLYHILPMTKIHTVEHYQNAIIILLIVGFILFCCCWSFFTKFLWKAQMFGMFVVVGTMYQLYVLGLWVEYFDCS